MTTIVKQTPLGKELKRAAEGVEPQRDSRIHDITSQGGQLAKRNLSGVLIFTKSALSSGLQVYSSFLYKPGNYCVKTIRFHRLNLPLQAVEFLNLQSVALLFCKCIY